MLHYFCNYKYDRKRTDQLNYEKWEIASTLHNESVEMLQAALEGEKKARAYDTAQAEQRTINMMSRQQTV